MTTKKLPNRHIEVIPGIAGGKPRIAGHRITVQNIVVWHERMGRGADEIANEYDLTLSDVYAALAYYYDHQFEIDRGIRESEAFAEKLREQIPSKMPEPDQVRLSLATRTPRRTPPAMPLRTKIPPRWGRRGCL